MRVEANGSHNVERRAGGEAVSDRRKGGRERPVRQTSGPKSKVMS